jgi:hypothetical protein
MSGGTFEYKQNYLLDIVDKIRELIANNNIEDEFGSVRNYSKETIEKFNETIYTSLQAYEMVRRVDWLLAGDDGEDDFHERWNKEVRTPYNATDTEKFR